MQEVKFTVKDAIDLERFCIPGFVGIEDEAQRISFANGIARLEDEFFRKGSSIIDRYETSGISLELLPDNVYDAEISAEEMRSFIIRLGKLLESVNGNKTCG